MAISIATILESLGMLVGQEFGFLEAVYAITQTEGSKIWHSPTYKRTHKRYDDTSEILNFSAHLGEYAYFRLFAPVRYQSKFPNQIEISIPIRIIWVGNDRSIFDCERASRAMFAGLQATELPSNTRTHWQLILLQNKLENVIFTFTMLKSYLGLHQVITLERPDIAHTPPQWDDTNTTLFATEIEIQATTENDYCSSIEWENCCG